MLIESYVIAGSLARIGIERERCRAAIADLLTDGQAPLLAASALSQWVDRLGHELACGRVALAAVLSVSHAPELPPTRQVPAEAFMPPPRPRPASGVVRATILRVLEARGMLSVAELFKAFTVLVPDLCRANFQQYLRRMVDEGLLQQPGYGYYALAERKPHLSMVGR